jgi:hypothetical protein
MNRFYLNKVKRALSTSSIKQTATLDTSKRLQLDSVLLDHSSASSNTGSGQTRSYSQQQLAGVRHKLKNC